MPFAAAVVVEVDARGLGALTDLAAVATFADGFITWVEQAAATPDPGSMREADFVATVTDHSDLEILIPDSVRRRPTHSALPTPHTAHLPSGRC